MITSVTSKNQKKTTVLKYIKLAWFIISLICLAYFAFRYQNNFIQYYKQLSATHIFLSVSCIIIGKIILSSQVRVSLELVQQPMSWLNSLYIYVFSDSAKYIPGGIWSTASRITYYRRHQIDYKSTAVAMLWENLLLTLSAFILGAIAFIIYLSWPYPATRALTIISIACLFYIWLSSDAIFCRMFSLKKFNVVKQFLNMIMPLTFSRIFFSLSLYFLLPLQTSSHHVNDLFVCFMAITIGKTIGMLAVFSPGGIGVREFLIYTILSYGISTSFSMQGAITSRISFFLAEALLFTITLLISYLDHTDQRS